MYYCNDCEHLDNHINQKLIKYNYHKQSCVKCDSENITMVELNNYFLRKLKLKRIFKT